MTRKTLQSVSTFLLAPPAFWAAALIVGLGAALIALAQLYSTNVGLQEDRRWWAGLLWFVLVGQFIAANIFWFTQRHKAFSITTWSASLLITGSIVSVFLAYVESLLLYPSSFVTYDWEFLDKRWIVWLYLCGLGTIYLPAFIKRIVLLVVRPGQAPVPIETGCREKNSSNSRASWSWLNIAACILAGSVVSMLYLAPQIPLVDSAPLEAHEWSHLGALQRMHLGATAFVEAKTQYGPGRQAITYALMKPLGFTMLGFRFSEVFINVVGYSILFAVTLFSFGWSLGTLTILLFLFISPLVLGPFFGWNIVFRWIGPVLIGLLLPRMCWSGHRTHSLYTAPICLGAACGMLAWFSQENLSTTAMTAALIVIAAFSLARLSLRQAVTVILLFLVTELAIFITMLVGIVGFDNLRPALALYFRGGKLLAAGVQNTAWASPGSPWEISYYLTPYLVLVVTILTLYASRHGSEKFAPRRGRLLGMAAAAAALAPITMFRADEFHFLGPSTALAPLIVLVLAYLPGLLFRDWRWRGACFVLSAAVFLLIYPFPRTLDEVFQKFRPQAEAAAHTMTWLDGIRRRATEKRAPDILTERLGFEPDANALCCIGLDWTYGDLEILIQDIRDLTRGRTVFVDHIHGLTPSMPYFFGDLKVAISLTEPRTLLWVESDLMEWERELRQADPNCVVSSSADRPFTKLILQSGRFSEHKVATKVDVFVFCKQEALEPSSAGTRGEGN